jgi:hypothetical protein
VSLFCIPLIVGFVETVLAITSGGMTHTQGIVSPVELFFIFFDTAVVTFSPEATLKPDLFFRSCDFKVKRPTFFLKVGHF